MEIADTMATHEDTLARVLALLDRPDLHFMDRKHLMAYLSGLLSLDQDKPRPESLVLWQRAMPHLLTDKLLARYIEHEEFPEGSLGAWVQQTVQEELQRKAPRQDDA